MNIDTKKIGQFLESIGDAEFLYLQHSVNMRLNLQHMIDKDKLTLDQVSERFGLSKRETVKFTKGNRNYSIEDMGKLNSWFIKLESSKLEEAVPCRF